MTILRRMAGASDPGANAAEPAPGLLKAMTTAFMRLGARSPLLDLTVTETRCVSIDAAEALDALDENALVLPLRGTEAVSAGALVMAPELIDVLVEVQTLGHVEPGGRPPRKPTRIDAALTRPYAQAVLDETRHRMDGRTLPDLHPDRYYAGSAQLRRETDSQRVVLAEIGLSFANGARTTTCSLLLPVQARRASEPSEEQPVVATSPEDTLMAAVVRMEALLPVLNVPLSTLTDLAVGDVIPLPEGALGRITLRGGRMGTGRPMPQRMGGAIAARLGQQGGLRAVKLIDEAAEGTDRDMELPIAAAASTKPIAPPAGRQSAAPPKPDAALDAAGVGDLPGLDDLPELEDLPDL